MLGSHIVVHPKFKPPLDGKFLPASLYNQAYQTAIGDEGLPLVIGLERSPDAISTFETRVFPPQHPYALENFFYLERIVKFLLWQRGGYRLYIGGPPNLGDYIQRAYATGGMRHFDRDFLSERVYERPFTVIACRPEDVPHANEVGKPLGRCTSGSGGNLITENAHKVLQFEFPELAARINLQLPAEYSRRVAQSIAAASLPEISR